MQRGHARVHGVTTEPLGPFPAGTPYSATDPRLMLWVHATLVHVSLELYQRHVRRASAREEERYYREMAVVAQIFGTPAAGDPALARRVPRVRRGADRRVARSPRHRLPRAQSQRSSSRAPLPAPMRVLAPAHRLATAAHAAAAPARGVRAALEPGPSGRAPRRGSRVPRHDDARAARRIAPPAAAARAHRRSLTGQLARNAPSTTSVVPETQRASSDAR